MTTPTSTPKWDAPVPVTERDTDQITGGRPDIVDALQMLDHRTRERTVLQEVAPPGRYLGLEHHGRHHLIALDRPIIHIGRGLIADVRLEDTHVSRRHAIVALRGEGPGSVRVLDDRSSGGTFVNGRVVESARLTDGDIIRIGRVAMRYTEIAPRLRPNRSLRRIPLSLRPRAGAGAAA